MGNISTGGTISATGNITGGNILGGANVNATTHTGTTVSVTGNITGGNVLFGAGIVSGTGNITATNLTGTLQTAAQTNITSVGTLSSLSVSGTATVGNVSTIGTVSATGNITGGNVLFGSGIVSGTGNITGGNISTAGTVIAASNFIINAPSPSAEGAQIVMAWANISGLTGQANSTWNIDVDGPTNPNLRIFYQNAAGTTAVPVNISSATNTVSMIGSLSVNSGAAVTAIINGATTGVGNIGSSTVTFNTVFAKATTAQYADLAEKYSADAEYEPGTVVEFGGDAEITISTTDASNRIAGVVSTNPAHLMNSHLDADFTVDLALAGRVPVKVQGPIRKGDMLVSAGNGRARAEADPKLGSVIGKALENFTNGEGTIEVLILML